MYSNRKNKITSNLFLYMCMVYHSFANVTDNNINNELFVQTDSGPIEGVIVKTFNGKDVTAFYGIPYAEPPVGNLRFKPPLPVKPWTEVFKASTKPQPCYQQRYLNDNKVPIRRPWSEDCLKLNVWIPKTVNLVAEGPKLAVITFIHGGSFISGSGLSTGSTEGGTLALEGEVYVVTLNYRLGAFGFLYYGHPEAPGNMGLMDQQLAIKWIYKNIPNFGKNTGSIILWGVGAGSASASYHMLSRGSAGLFKTVAHRSGVSIDPMSFSKVIDSKKRAESLAESLNCKKDNITEEIECLRSIHAEDIIDASVMELHSVLTPDHFKPTVDGQFITLSPQEALQQGIFNNITVMCTTTAQDGSTSLLILNPDLKSSFHKGISRDDFRKAVKRLSPALTETDLDLVEDVYLSNCSLSDPLNNLNAAVMVYTDVLYACPANQLLKLLSKHNVDAYSSVYARKLSKYPEWMGAFHGIETITFFGYPLLGEAGGFSKEEFDTSLKLMQTIREVTKLRVENLKEYMKPYNADNPECLKRTYTSPPTLEKDYRGRECRFWMETLPQLQATRKECSHNV